MASPTFTDPDALAAAIIARVGPRVVLALPLGLGKACTVADALYRRVAADPSLHLTIFTALTLEAPRPKADIERRFMGPIIARTVGGYPTPLYATAARTGTLPPNVVIDEFFFQAATRLNSPRAQEAYISANYTHALNYILERGVNVLGQLVASRGEGAERRLSLSCNTDISLDLLKCRREGRANFLLVGQTNAELPFMGGEGDLPASDFDFLLDAHDFPLLAPPKEAIGPAQYAIGFHVASLIPDGGTLQLGIGGIADAICQALIVRHRSPELFAATVERLCPGGGGVERHVRSFETGLYACTEMFVDGFLQLIRAGVVKREVDGIVLHGGFFLGPRDFYAALRDLPEIDARRIDMTAISFTNALYGDEANKRAARTDARFCNTAMMATLMGAVVSDQLEDGRVVSGVGGQFDFVAQAFALGPTARAMITLNAIRSERGRAQSNIRWTYGHTTIPRHMRDVIVTEYGVADLRGQPDATVIERMLAVTDSRFVDGLAAQAKAAGKLGAAASIASARNTPANLFEALAPVRDAGLIPPFPFGSDLTLQEQALGARLQRIQAAARNPFQLLSLALRGALARPDDETHGHLDRLDLARPTRLHDRLSAALVRGAA